MKAGSVKLKCEVALKSIAGRYRTGLNTPWLSNQLGNGISHMGRSGL